MEFENEYKKAFSRVHPSADFDPEEIIMKAQNRKKIRPLTLKRIITVAAAAAVITAFALTASATEFFGIGKVLLKNAGDEAAPPSISAPAAEGSEPAESPAEPAPTPDEYEHGTEFVSLSGYVYRPESKALAEWKSFTDSYDADGAILASVGNSSPDLGADTALYYCYTQEMADTLRGIAEKYSLKLHTERQMVMPEEWSGLVGEFLTGGKLEAYSGYIYENGTFQFDGDYITGGGSLVGLQMRRMVYGSLDEVVLNIGNADDYESWGMEAASGHSVTLAMSGYKSVIMADLGSCFVFVNLLGGTDTGLTRSDVEAAVLCLDLDVLA